MKKSKRNKFRKKTIKKRFRKSYKLQKGGTNTIIIKDDNDLEKKKNILEKSYDKLSNIVETYIGLKNKEGQSYHSVTTTIGATVSTLYANPLTYNYFHKFFENLIVNNIVKCNACVIYYFTLPGSGRALYKIYKIYFVIGFIIAYYYKNPTKFISEKFLEKYSNMQYTDVIIYLLQNAGGFLACNSLYSVSNYCYIKENLDEFISLNKFDVSENIEITRLIFNFFENTVFFQTLKLFGITSQNNFFDPTLKPQK